ncbi:helix-turn-helix transcriptional regulator [Herbaspirillum sp. NPDC087042]|uniref:helix-turn-helix transcriptional regulator n=1 Tax=Herbaspirillum sp. NPDC087042 TaxID=3364004 RepID=UPI0038116C61
MANDFPISISAQLREHLRALRKQQHLTQAQLGQRIGVSQARIAEIEANPGAVSVEQMLLLLSTLGASLHLHLHLDPRSDPPAQQVAEPAAAPYTPGTPIPRKRGSW